MNNRNQKIPRRRNNDITTWLPTLSHMHWANWSANIVIIMDRHSSILLWILLPSLFLRHSFENKMLEQLWMEIEKLKSFLFTSIPSIPAWASTVPLSIWHNQATLVQYGCVCFKPNYTVSYVAKWLHPNLCARVWGRSYSHQTKCWTTPNLTIETI